MQIPLFLQVVVVASSVIKPRVPTCSEIILPVSIHAENLALPATLSAQELETLVNSLGAVCSLWEPITSTKLTTLLQLW